MPSRKNRRNMPTPIIEAIKNLLLGNRYCTGKELKKAVELIPKLKKYGAYSIRAYQKNKETILENMPDVPDQDSRWSVGNNLNDGIPSEAIEKLIAIQTLLMSRKHHLTNLRSRFIARLYKVLVPILQRDYPDGEGDNFNYNAAEERDLVLLQIASFYTRKAQLSPKKEDNTYDGTLELDNQFLITQDVSFETILRIWIEMFFFYVRFGLKGETIDYELDPALNEFIEKLFVDDDGTEAASFIEDHPKLRVNALRWMALSTREDLLKLNIGYLEGEE